MERKSSFLVRENITQEDIDDFWIFTTKDRDEVEKCWHWYGEIDLKGYGKLPLGFVDGKSPYWLAHRLSWVIHYGDIIDGLFVCHKCDNPSCVNPHHLFLGTHKDNMRDMVIKKRRRNHKLSIEQAREIKQRALSSETTTLLSKEFKVSKSHVSNIKAGRTGNL